MKWSRSPRRTGEGLAEAASRWSRRGEKGLCRTEGEEDSSRPGTLLKPPNRGSTLRTRHCPRYVTHIDVFNPDGNLEGGCYVLCFTHRKSKALGK